MPAKKAALPAKVRPVGEMVLICHDEDQKVTAGGIILPNATKVLTGRIVAVPEKMKENQIDYPFQELDRVIYDPRESIPVELLPQNRYFLVEAKYIYAVVEAKNERDE